MRASTTILLLVLWVLVYPILTLVLGYGIGVPEIVLFWVIFVAIVSLHFSLHEKNKENKTGGV